MEERRSIRPQGNLSGRDSNFKVPQMSRTHERGEMHGLSLRGTHRYEPFRGQGCDTRWLKKVYEEYREILGETE